MPPARLAARLVVLLQESDDPDTQTACVVHDATGRVLAEGVNRLPLGVARTDARVTRPAKYDYLVHAEQVAIGTAARQGHALEGATMVLNWFPCAPCARLMVTAGIAHLVADEAVYTARRHDPRYGFEAAEAILREGGVTVGWWSCRP